MATITPADRWHTRTNQDSDEMGAVFAELQRDPMPFLTHRDAEVRSLADWVLEHFGIRRLRPVTMPYHEARIAGHTALIRLYKRLRAVAIEGRN